MKIQKGFSNSKNNDKKAYSLIDFYCEIAEYNALARIARASNPVQKATESEQQWEKNYGRRDSSQ